MATHELLRIDFNAVERLIDAMKRAQAKGALEPLENVIPLDEVSADQHVLTGRKYLLFGSEQKELIGVGALLRLGFKHAAQQSFDAGSGLTVGLERARAEAVPEAELQTLANALEFDRGIPESMSGDSGPALVNPDQVEKFRRALEALKATPTNASDLALDEELSGVLALLDQVGPGEALVLLRS